MPRETVWLDVPHGGVIRDTAKATLFNFPNKGQVWIPNSQIRDHDDEVVSLSQWIYEQNLDGEVCLESADQSAKGAKDAKSANPPDETLARMEAKLDRILGILQKSDENPF